MNFLDIRTVMFGQLLMDILCTAVMISLWLQNRKRYAGLSLWVVDFAFQTTSALLVILRGSIPDAVSIGFSNPLVMVGALFGYLGLARFVGKRVSQFPNELLLGSLILGNFYFIYVQPDLAARNIIVSAGLLVICFQCAWLMLPRTAGASITRGVGVVFALFCLFSMARIVIIFANPPASNDFFQSGLYNALILLAYEVLIILLTFGLTLMVNRRLLIDVKTQEEKFTAAMQIDSAERQKVEEIKKESEERYHFLFENMLNGYAYCQMIFEEDRPQDFIYLDVNRAFEALTGLKDVTGKRVSEVIPGIRESDAELFEIYGRVALTGRPEVFETYVASLKMWFSISVYSYLKGFFVAIFDVITERKLAEQKLREDEARLHLALDAAHGGVWEWDLRTNENIWSEELWKVYGLEPHSCEPSYEAWVQTIHPDDLERASQAVSRAAQEASELNAEWRVRDPDGKERWVMSRGQPILNAGGQVERYIGAALDITERKQAEAEIKKLNADLEQRVRERTAELDDLYNNAPCGYHSLDGSGTYLHINDTELNWLGYTREEIIGKIRVPDLITPESLQVYQANFPILKERGWIKDVRLQFKRKDGSILPVLISATAIKDSDGNYQSSRTTLVDYSSLKQAEDTLHQSHQKLEAVNKELETFAYSVSHDLRAPLRGIDGWSLALLEDYQDRFDDQGRLYIERVRSETKRMGLLIDELLQLSRVTRAEMQTGPVDISSLAQTIIDRLYAAQPERQVEVVIQPGLTASGDASLLAIVLTNLLDNAWKFTARRDAARIELWQTDLQGEHVFYVRDNGAGFDMKYAQKLFGPFQRMHKVSEFPGTGVGLATVQRIINRHGGRVWAEAELDHGATFFFTLEEKA